MTITYLQGEALGLVLHYSAIPDPTAFYVTASKQGFAYAVISSTQKSLSDMFISTHT